MPSILCNVIVTLNILFHLNISIDFLFNLKIFWDPEVFLIDGKPGDGTHSLEHLVRLLLGMQHGSYYVGILFGYYLGTVKSIRAGLIGPIFYYFYIAVFSLTLFRNWQVMNKYYIEALVHSLLGPSLCYLFYYAEERKNCKEQGDISKNGLLFKFYLFLCIIMQLLMIIPSLLFNMKVFQEKAFQVNGKPGDGSHPHEWLFRTILGYQHLSYTIPIIYSYLGGTARSIKSGLMSGLFSHVIAIIVVNTAFIKYNLLTDGPAPSSIAHVVIAIPFVLSYLTAGSNDINTSDTSISSEKKSN